MECELKCSHFTKRFNVEIFNFHVSFDCKHRQIPLYWSGLSGKLSAPKTYRAHQQLRYGCSSTFDSFVSMSYTHENKKISFVYQASEEKKRSPVTIEGTLRQCLFLQLQRYY